MNLYFTKVDYMKIRKFEKNDVDKIKFFISQLKYFNYVERCKKEGWPINKNMKFEQTYEIKENFKGKNIIFVAEENKKIIGFCWLIIYDYGPEKIAEIAQLMIENKYRKKGMGSKLVKKAKKIAEKEDVDVVLVSTIDDETVKFYEKQGFCMDKGKWLIWNKNFK